MQICWVPGHQGIKGIEETEEQSRRGSAIGEVQVALTVVLSLCELNMRVSMEIMEKTNNSWLVRDGCVSPDSLIE